ncbi:hypothetical protein [Metapseudomonas boanensis]|uniref:Lipoprotein n=1 Tax=Metapseudomonas boanensis TaxID=2822138 RepID=A0ABS5XPH0_9GAMM|nr:hypothetical protein [Pseudomonas boanensis]MBT8769602.1 hypothetical protein [Pseudomonas boanensis]
MKNTLIKIAPIIMLSANCIAEKSSSPITISIKYSNQEGCSFSFSPINFCDKRRIQEMEKALINTPPNFNKHYIIAIIPERMEYHQNSIVAIDSRSGVAYPVPIDAYSGTPNKDDPKGKNGSVIFEIGSNKLCIEGEILAARALESGLFCFYFKDEKFTGHKTSYMHD